MREFTISGADAEPFPALAHGRRLAADVAPHHAGAPRLLCGDSQLNLAAIAAWALIAGHAIVLQPKDIAADALGVPVAVAADGASARPAMNQDERPGWLVGMYTSGSTGRARGYGFTSSQLDQLAVWYTAIYNVTDASVICTHLPMAYNFAFVAGLYLAATLGARLHLTADPQQTFADAARLAPCHDRCIILGNPLLLDQPPAFRLPSTVLIDSGGAPLSTTAIIHYRQHVADLREGYGLTETGSLTHFDTQGTPESLGTVGVAMPKVDTAIVREDKQPRIALRTPALGVPITHPAVPSTGQLVTADVGAIDEAGRLRVLGRSDDYPVGGLWPRDSLDAIGPLLGTACALVRHPDPAKVHIRLRRPLPADTIEAIRARVAACTDTSPAAVTVDVAEGRLLHSHKLPRTTSLHRE
jgi:hypothetical protein